MKTFTKRILSFALALIMTAMCFAGMTVVVIAEDEIIPEGWYAVEDVIKIDFGSTPKLGTQGGFNFVLGEGTFNVFGGSYDAEVGHNAPGSVKLHMNEDKTGSWMFWTKGKLEQGKNYLISCYVKGTAGAKFQIQFEGLSNGPEMELKSSDWTLYTWRVNTAPIAYSTARKDNSYPFKVRVPNNTTPVYFDDLTITEITQEVSLIDKNGGFLKFDLYDPDPQAVERGYAYATMSKSIALTKDKTYTVSYKIKTDTLGINLAFDRYISGSYTQSVFKGADETFKWQTISYDYTPTDDATSVRFYFNTKTYGTALIDDISIVEKDTGNVVLFEDYNAKNPGVSGRISWIPYYDYSKLPGNENGGYVAWYTPDTDGTGSKYTYTDITLKGLLLKPETTYSVTYDYFTDNTDVAPAFDYWGKKPSGTSTTWRDDIVRQNIIKAQEAGKWQACSFDFTTGNDDVDWTATRSARFYINTKGKYGSALIDNIKICEKNNPEKVVYIECFNADVLNSSNYIALCTSVYFDKPAAKFVPCVDVTITDLNKDRTFAGLKYVINHNTKNKDNNAKKNYGGNLQFDVTGAKPGVTYVASYDVYFTALQAIGQRVYADGYINLGSGWGTPSKVGVWETISNEFTIGEGKNLTYIDFYINDNNGNENLMLFDNVKIYEKDHPENVLCDYNLDYKHYSALSATIGFWKGAEDITKLPENIHGGYVKFTLPDSGTSLVYAEIGRSFKAMTAGNTYEVSFRMLSDATGRKFGFDAQKTTGGYDSLKWYPNSQVGVWETITFDYTPTTNSTGGRFYFNSNVYGTSLVDYISIKDKTTGEYLVKEDFNCVNPNVSGKASWVPYDCIDDPHVYDNDCDTSCNLCGETRTITHDFTEYSHDGTNHWIICSVCSEVKPESTEMHSFDNACDTTCDTCGYIRTVPHDFSEYAHDDANHWIICSVCSEVMPASTEAHCFDHAYDDTCDACKYTRTVPTCGDINGDGYIDLLDLIVFAKYNLNIPDVVIVEANSDINADGKIDGLDLTALAKYMLEIEDELPIIGEKGSD